MSTQPLTTARTLSFPDSSMYRTSDGIDEKLLIGRLRKQLFSRAAGHVLDVACGDGANFRYYPADCRITAGDLSMFQLSTARSRGIALGRDIEVRQLDAEDIPYPDGTFDTVVSSLGLCSYSDPVRALREFARVVKPDGRILLLEHGRSSIRPIAAWQDQYERRRGDQDGCHNNREPLQLAEEAGLEIVEARRTFLGVMHSIEARPGAAKT